MLLPLFLSVGILLLSSTPSCLSESPTCLAVYKEGGAPAVFRSPKCHRWTLSPEDLRRPVRRCFSALHQGRRRNQEDRLVCALDLRIPFLGREGIEQMNVGLVGVFDGHNGDEASDIASNLLLEYFLLHVYFLLDGVYSMVLKGPLENHVHEMEHSFMFQEFNFGNGLILQNMGSKRFEWLPPLIFQRQFHMEILKESLLRAIRDIDVTFSEEAYRRELQSGSTAVIVLLADGQILTANVGDSKAILCSESFSRSVRANISKRHRRHERGVASHSHHGNSKATNNGHGYIVKELTRDHHPDIIEEKKRVEAAGGYVMEWAGVYRVNGMLAVSRAIGDMPFKSYGVISTPEVTDWQMLFANDSYLIVASDGVFEKMTMQEVCDLLWDNKLSNILASDVVPSPFCSLADCIVATAFERDTVDNMAVIIVPLESNGDFGNYVNDECDLNGNFESSCGLRHVMYKKSPIGSESNARLLPMDYIDRITSMFNSLVVEAKREKLGFYYLSENLNEKIDYVFPYQSFHRQDDMHELSLVLRHPNVFCCGDSPDLHCEKTFHTPLQIYLEGERDQCPSLNFFVKLLGLLDSIPHSERISNSSESFGRKIPGFRYILNRRFDHGAYGEVWSAHQWYWPQFVETRKNQENSSHFGCHDNMFILKRIMVEKGTSVYLSGLREKYFGEKFLNVSATQSRWRDPGLVNSMENPQEFDLNTVEINKTYSNEFRYFSDSTSGMYDGGYEASDFNFEEGLNHIARYVESFETELNEIWLVFKNEGISLSKLIYSAEEINNATNDDKVNQERKVQILRPSTWWHWLRTTEAGQEELRSIVWQLLLAVKSCHDRNITHRDIKPENMIICFEDMLTGLCSREIPSQNTQYRLKMRIIDFGSAVDEFTIKHMYGSGPSRFEQTLDYTPPEALFNASWFRAPKSVTSKYDMWSVGVVILELILGSPHVFEISDRTRALLDQHLGGWNEHFQELAYRLWSYMEMCILIPGGPSLNHQDEVNNQDGLLLAPWKCSEEYFFNQVQNRDPLRFGFQNIWAMRLVRQLLVWRPEDRLNVNDALRHPFFYKDR